MIKNIGHKHLRNYWIKGQTKGLNSEWLQKLYRIMSALHAAERPEDMNYPGSHFHQLSGARVGEFSVRITGNYRVTFGWDAEGATNVNIEDYH